MKSEETPWESIFDRNGSSTIRNLVTLYLKPIFHHRISSSTPLNVLDHLFVDVQVLLHLGRVVVVAPHQLDEVVDGPLALRVEAL